MMHPDDDYDEDEVFGDGVVYSPSANENKNEEAMATTSLNKNERNNTMDDSTASTTGTHTSDHLHSDDSSLSSGSDDAGDDDQGENNHSNHDHSHNEDEDQEDEQDGLMPAETTTDFAFASDAAGNAKDIYCKGAVTCDESLPEYKRNGTYFQRKFHEYNCQPPGWTNTSISRMMSPAAPSNTRTAIATSNNTCTPTTNRPLVVQWKDQLGDTMRQSTRCMARYLPAAGRQWYYFYDAGYGVTDESGNDLDGSYKQRPPACLMWMVLGLILLGLTAGATWQSNHTAALRGAALINGTDATSLLDEAPKPWKTQGKQIIAGKEEKGEEQQKNDQVEDKEEDKEEEEEESATDEGGAEKEDEEDEEEPNSDDGDDEDKERDYEDEEADAQENPSPSLHKQEKNAIQQNDGNLWYDIDNEMLKNEETKAEEQKSGNPWYYNDNEMLKNEEKNAGERNSGTSDTGVEEPDDDGEAREDDVYYYDDDHDGGDKDKSEGEY